MEDGGSKEGVGDLSRSLIPNPRPRFFPATFDIPKIRISEYSSAELGLSGYPPH